MAEAAGREAEHFPLFDWLRISLAVGVFVSHADDGAFLPEKLGNACVQVFFALSGFLIGGILIRSSAGQLPRFYFNRCLRIWVPYALAFLVLFAGTVLRQPLGDPKLWEIIFYKLTFVYAPFGLRQIGTAREHMPLDGTGNHFWSICIEEQFYVVAPFVLVYLRKWRVPLLLAVVALNFFHRNSFAPISLGVLLAISRAHWGAWYLRRPAMVTLAALVLGSSLVCWFFPQFYETWVGLPAVGAVALFARPGSATPLGLTLGGMSYPFYLNSWIGLFLRKTVARHLPGGMVVATLVAFAVAATFAFLHYRLIDRQLHEVRGRWYTPRRGGARQGGRSRSRRRRLRRGDRSRHLSARQIGVAACKCLCDARGVPRPPRDRGLRASVLALAVLAGCSGGSDGKASCPKEAPAMCPAPPPSFATQAKAVFASRCGICHGPNGIESRQPLQSHADIAAKRAAIKAQLENCQMPPADAPQLTTDERQLLLGWLACGAPDN